LTCAAKEKYTEAEAAHVMQRLLQALRVLHKNGIVHRDLKPENLVFSTEADDSDLKITDFGLSTLSDANGECMMDAYTGAMVGTPGYVAPEVITQRQYGPACDVWSLGVIMYILLAGYPPFHTYETKVPLCTCAVLVEM
jgi:calcium/calmodulin-dependent protein kinase I